MTDLQLCLAITVVVNFGVTVTFFTALTSHMNARFDAIDRRFDVVVAELRRVEEALDARLKHLEK